MEILTKPSKLWEPGTRLLNLVFFVLLFLVIPHVSAQKLESSDTSTILVVLSKPDASYEQVLAVLQKTVVAEGREDYRFRAVSIKAWGNEANLLSTINPELIVTVGTKAAENVLSKRPEIPVLSILITDSAFSSITEKYYGSLNVALESGVSAIILGQPPSRSVRLAKLLVPDAVRTGVMVGPVSFHWIEQIKDEIVNNKMEPNLIAIEPEDNPIHMIEPVIKNSDVFIPVPDSRLINISTARWILQLSYRYKVPVIAYSKTYVQAGALAAVYSSPEDVARQAANQILQGSVKSGVKGKKYSPEYFSVSLNRSVARNLNIQLKDEHYYLKQL